jgi:putative transport protein
VSESYPIGQRIADLRLPERFGAVITRVQRGDTDRLARADMVLEPGDRIRVVAPRHRMPELTVFFGDSYRRLSEIDVAAFSLGVTGGMLLGLVPIPLPGGATFKLGMAGGPLLVGLVLGALRRTGPITWQLSYNASLTLRQLGVVLFLAGVGTRSGYAFVDTIRHGQGLLLVAAGAAVTTTAALAMLFLGHRVLRVPVPILAGIIGGLQTQPAVLAFAAERSGNDLPNTGYATVYPVATVMKIVLAQLLLLFAA